MRYILKKAVQILLFIILLLVLFLLYVIGGVILSYRRQPAVSQEYKSDFHADDCYSDSVSCDRACIIENNTEALLQRLKMIEQAKERIILSTFEFRADESGMDVLAALLAAARRGVDVKIIADGMSAYLRMEKNEYFHALAAEDNVEIKIYNRFNPFTPWKLMGRLHDKYLIADRDVYILGGRNTYNYFLSDAGYKNYDRDVLVYNTDPDGNGSSLRQLEDYFESVWKLEENTLLKPWSADRTASAKKELEERYQRLKTEQPALAERADYEKMTFEVNKITLLTNPTHVYAKEPTVFYSLAEIMKQFKGDIFIHTPYIICNDWMYDSLQEICRVNPQTSLLTNSAGNNGNPFGASDYLMHKDRLLDTGLTLYEYEGGVSYHGKSISIGDRLSIVGSFNIDMRSVYLDTEQMLVIDSKGVNRQLRDNMEVYEAASVKVLDKEHQEIPENVTRQEISPKRRWMVKTLRFFNWLRFLM